MYSVQKAFDELVKAAKNDNEVVGVFLGGSRTKPPFKPSADYDIGIVAKSSAADRAMEKYRLMKKQSLQNGMPMLDIFIFSNSDFAEKPKTIDPSSYYYEHAKVLAGGKRFADLIKAKGMIAENLADRYVADSLNGYIYHTYNMVKCIKDNRVLASKLESSAAVICLINFVFGLERRFTPFYGYLEWELTNHPPKNLPLNKQLFIKSLNDAINEYNANAHKRLYKAMLNVAKKFPQCKGVIESWNSVQDFMEDML